MGTFEQRYQTDEMDINKMVVQTASVCVNESQLKLNVDPDELMLELDLDNFDNDELTARSNGRLRCFRAREMSLAKLALLLVLRSDRRWSTDTLHRQCMGFVEIDKTVNRAGYRFVCGIV